MLACLVLSASWLALSLVRCRNMCRNVWCVVCGVAHYQACGLRQHLESGQVPTCLSSTHQGSFCLWPVVLPLSCLPTVTCLVYVTCLPCHMFAVCNVCCKAHVCRMSCLPFVSWRVQGIACGACVGIACNACLWPIAQGGHTLALSLCSISLLCLSRPDGCSVIVSVVQGVDRGSVVGRDASDVVCMWSACGLHSIHLTWSAIYSTGMHWKIHRTAPVVNTASKDSAGVTQSLTRSLAHSLRDTARPLVYFNGKGSRLFQREFLSSISTSCWCLGPFCLDSASFTQHIRSHNLNRLHMS